MWHLISLFISFWPSLFILFIGPVYSFVYYFILAQPCGMWHLSSLIKDGTCALSSGSIES